MGKAHRMHNHQRHTTPFDNMPPPERMKSKLRRYQQRMGWYQPATSVIRQVGKQLQTRKQRQWNRRVLVDLATDEEGGEG